MPAASTPHRDPPPGRATLITIGILLVMASVAGVVWFLGRDAPDAVSIDAAAEHLGSGSASPDGTWVVDTSLAPFSLEESTGTFVGFRVREELANVGAAEAVARTPAVEGAVTFADGTLTATEIVADLTELVSDQSRRDRQIQVALRTADHPTATFSLDGPVEVGSVEGGVTIEVTAVGTLTVNGVANEVVVPLAGVLAEDAVAVTGSFEVVFSDYDVEVPTAPIVVSVEDRGEVELQLYLVRD